MQTLFFISWKQDNALHTTGNNCILASPKELTPGLHTGLKLQSYAPQFNSCESKNPSMNKTP